MPYEFPPAETGDRTHDELPEVDTNLMGGETGEKPLTFDCGTRTAAIRSGSDATAATAAPA